MIGDISDDVVRTDKFDESYKNWFNVRDDLKHLSVEELNRIADRDRGYFSVCALNIEGDLNVGMMIRTAHLLGVNNFYVFGRRRIDNRSLVGSDKYTNLHKIHGLDDSGALDLDAFQKMLDDHKLFPVFVEQGGDLIGTNQRWQDTFSYASDRDKQVCLVFGNEATGIPEEFLDLDCHIVSIPQRGVLRSYNVAAAAGIVMWDMYRDYII